jgi:TetR/AcrR family transcriptional regulator, transcriptional repressor for nem operon
MKGRVSFRYSLAGRCPSMGFAAVLLGRSEWWCPPRGAAEAFDYTWEAAWNSRLLHVDEKASGIEKLKQLITNFVEHRSPVAGGCPILNTAIDADDGNPVLRAHVAKALRSWLSRLQTIVDQAQARGETQPGVDPQAVATLIVASLEGALMMSRIQRNDDALRRIRAHLNRYLDDEVAAS